jgi:two-component system, chemotaxis family, CheB/CheR fusion protein
MHLEKQTTAGNEHYIVAIGASAGGLEAIHEFFDNMPSNGNLSFIIIQHLSPDYKSLLVELIAKHTHMHVFEADHEMEVKENSVYVIPNNKLLTIKGGRLQLEAKSTEKAPNTAVDTFLRSLAKDQGSKAIAIILSGTGTDGSKGIMDIHQKEGLVLVQDPVTAKFDGMPNSAIATGVVDFIMAPELMPEEIFNYINEKPEPISIDGRPDESALPEVLRLIERNCQQDFSNYKTPTILRRITRRMGLLGYKKFQEYFNLLRNSPEECRFLSKEFLIGVTKFFRDKAAFTILRNEVLVPMIKEKEDDEILKVWVTACSTGEEAYSMAILIDDLLLEMDRKLDVKIFASDIDSEAIEFASKACYSADALKEIEPQLVEKYFLEEGNKYTVQPKLRKQIVFARHNILKDPPFIKNDVVTCRNLLIYMNSILQRKVISTLQFSLNTGGCLFLGPSESPVNVYDGFRELNGKWKLYQKVVSDSRYNPERLPSAQAFKTTKGIAPQPSKEAGVMKDLSEDFKAMLTDKYGFAALYIDKNFEIKEAIGDFKKYLSLPDRLISLNLLKMVSKQLSINLNAAVRKSLKENQEVALSNVRVGEDKDKSLNIYIRPSARNGYIMIVIGENHTPFARSSTETSLPSDVSSVRYINDLEDELKETRANLQMTVESLETANEELQSSNEELLSANEELQSSNEELQSLNEELHTLNTEHQLRIRELIELNDDLNNYFRSSEIAQVFVDGDFRIRKFNPGAVRMINLIESDIGRPIVHISTNIRDSKNFIEDIQQVMKSQAPLEKEVQMINGSMQLMKIFPYLKQDKKVDGVVITFIDITGVKELNSIIRSVFNATQSAIMAFKAIRNSKTEIVDLEWLTANYAADELLQRASGEYVGKTIKNVFPQIMKTGFLEKCAKVINEGEFFHTEMELDLEKGSSWFDVIATPMMDGMVISLTDISDKKNAEENLKQNYEALVESQESYRVLNQQLEELVKQRTADVETQKNILHNLFMQAPAMICTLKGPDYVFELVNPQYQKLFGNRVLQGKPMLEAAPELKGQEIVTILDTVYRTGRPFVGKEYCIWLARGEGQEPDEAYFNFVYQATYNEHKKVDGILVFAYEVTEQVKARKAIQDSNEELLTLNQEFQFVTDFMPQMVWVTLPDGDHIFFNKGWYEYTGLSAEVSMGDGWNKVLHPDDRERAWQVWKRSLETGEPYEIEYRFRRHDGEYRWFLGRALALKNEEGEVMKWFGTCTDIHDQKSVNDILEKKVKDRTMELERMNAELEASNSELTQFASVASHDLKEPLRKIIMFSNILKDRHQQDLQKGALEYLEKIIGSSSRMGSLVTDLLSFTKLASSEGNFEPTDLNTVLAEVLSDLELTIEEKKAVIRAEKLPVAEVLAGQMRQVFQNIISNSLKFSKPGVPPEIKIQCARVSELSFVDSYDQQGQYFRITIEDNGIGFSNEYADKIFTIFQRLHTRSQYEGTGIGLAIAKKIISKHNGIIKASGKEGEGARFVMVLPLVHVEEPLNIEGSRTAVERQSGEA